MLSITATSHATLPITIFTWPTVFNLDLAQERRNFTCFDLTANEALDIELTKGPSRPEYSREAGGLDDEYFHTLDPEVPVTFRERFSIACHPPEGEVAVVPGHRYRFALSAGENVAWWQYRTKAEVMAPAGQHVRLGQSEGPEIVLDHVEAVEFELLVDPRSG